MIGEARNFCKECNRGFPTPEALSGHFCEAFYLLRMKDLKPKCPFHLNCNANAPDRETRKQIRKAKAEIRGQPVGYGTGTEW